MATRIPIELGEWYHCYNRGVDKRRVFETNADYERFLLQLYIASGSSALRIANKKEKSLYKILSDSSIDRGKPIVEIGAYCLLPNHFHILLKETQEGGIALFMQKAITGYTMYFNTKRERTGALFAGTYKSKHVHDDIYLKYLVSYIHLNPAELFESQWKEGIGNLKKIERFLINYPYSSLTAFRDSKHVTRKIIGTDIFTVIEEVPLLREMLTEAQNYYLENNIKV